MTRFLAHSLYHSLPYAITIYEYLIRRRLETPALKESLYIIRDFELRWSSGVQTIGEHVVPGDPSRRINEEDILVALRNPIEPQ